MDALTAGIGVLLVQLCMAVVMLGSCAAAPREISTRYWAAGGFLITAGALIAVANAGALRYAALAGAYTAIVFSAVLMWWGMRLFFGKPLDRTAGWVITATYFTAYSAFYFAGATPETRAILTAVAMIIVLILCLREVLLGRRLHATLGNTITLGGLAIVIVAYSSRAIGVAMGIPDFTPHKLSSAGVMTVYLAPMCGQVLLFSGLLLLHFEEMVRQRDHLATHDELTGLLNRRAIDATGRREVELAVRLKHSLCVALIDIDFFKQVNDRLGHHAGDIVLEKMGQVLRGLCRQVDLVGRYGGEEFCAIFPMLSPDGTAVVAERAVRAIRQHDFSPAGKITASIGIAVWSPLNEQVSWEQMIAHADAELYKAKNGGRDRYSIGVAEGRDESGAAAA